MSRIKQLHKALTEGLDMSKEARMQRAAEQGFEPGYYKGMYAYDWTKEADGYPGPVVSEINRTTPFPSFSDKDADVEGVAGFLTQDPAVASRFAPNSGGAVFPLMYRKGRELVIDAKSVPEGASKFGHAAAVQFGDSGQAFRDAVRSGDFDTITIKGTVDEGDVTVALNAANIRSINAAFDPAKKGSSNLLAGLGAGAVGASLLAPEKADASPVAAFAARRAEKNKYWDQIKGALEATAAIGSSVAGGVLSSVGRLGGALNPMVPPEASEAAGERAARGMQYTPSAAATPFLEPVVGALDTFSKDIERGHEHAKANSLLYREGVDALIRLYENLPPRMRNALKAGSELIGP